MFSRDIVVSSRIKNRSLFFSFLNLIGKCCHRIFSFIDIVYVQNTKWFLFIRAAAAQEVDAHFCLARLLFAAFFGSSMKKNYRVCRQVEYDNNKKDPLSICSHPCLYYSWSLLFDSSAIYAQRIGIYTHAQTHKNIRGRICAYVCARVSAIYCT